MMDPKDLKLPKSGVQCIGVDENEKMIAIIVPEGWSVHVMPSDSGQMIDKLNVPFGAVLTTRRVAPAPILIEMKKT